MARLFITPREINFINDIAKEVIKDVIGQKIYLFQISEIKSKVHDVYEESPDKVFESPIELDCLVKYNEQEIRTNRFGSTFFEVIKAPLSNTIFGQIEHKRFITISGRQARKDQFLSKIFGPTSEEYTDDDAVQDTFVQQRGFSDNRLGETGDVRALRKNGVLEDPITGPKEVSSKGDATKAGSSFYSDK